MNFDEFVEKYDKLWAIRYKYTLRIFNEKKDKIIEEYKASNPCNCCKLANGFHLPDCCFYKASNDSHGLRLLQETSLNVKLQSESSDTKGCGGSTDVGLCGFDGYLCYNCKGSDKKGITIMDAKQVTNEMVEKIFNTSDKKGCTHLCKCGKSRGDHTLKGLIYGWDKENQQEYVKCKGFIEGSESK